MSYQPTIGLEVHAELKTRTKMFCDSLNDPDEKHPNTNVCPVCLGHPGTLPTINKKAVEAVIKVGLAIGGKTNPLTKFDRKNYFYPDLPKGYQISQYDKPLVVGGELGGVKITRIHLEEDAGKLLHTEGSSDARSERQATLVDFNRAGVPLMELVTEPDIDSAEQAIQFVKELQLLLRYLEVSDADLERGQLRADANVSVSDSKKLGTRVEIKNLNSLRAIEDAVNHEIKRQTEVLESGKEVDQETRGWDEAKQKTVIQRSKEQAHDYRYFPEPDLPPIDTSVFDLEDMRAHLPELPCAKQARFQKEFGLIEKQAVLLVSDKKLADFFEAAVSELATRDNLTTSQIGKNPRELLYNYLTTDLLGAMTRHSTGFSAEGGSPPSLGFGRAGASDGEGLKVNPEEFAHLIDLIADGKIGSRQAKDILEKMVETGEDPEVIMRSEGLETVSDERELAGVVKEVIEKNPQAVADYKKGKTASVQFLVGQAMGKLRGRGNPEALKTMFERELTK